MGSLKINHYTITAESDGEKLLKIDQHLPKLWAIKFRVAFYETQCKFFRGLCLADTP